MIAGIVPAGGAGRRMGGVDKAALAVGGIPLLDRVLAAARPVCERLVVVGPTRSTTVAGVDFVVEDDPGGGPVPAVAVGLALLGPCEVVLVVAGDLPLLTAAPLLELIRELDCPNVDAAAADHRGGPNPLLAAYRATVLRSTAQGLGAGSPAALLLPPATVTVDLGPAALNVNRPEDLAAAEALLRGSAPPRLARPNQRSEFEDPSPGADMRSCAAASPLSPSPPSPPSPSSD